MSRQPPPAKIITKLTIHWGRLLPEILEMLMKAQSMSSKNIKSKDRTKKLFIKTSLSVRAAYALLPSVWLCTFLHIIFSKIAMMDQTKAITRVRQSTKNRF